MEYLPARISFIMFQALAEEIPVETPPKVKKATKSSVKKMVEQLEQPSYDEMVLATLKDLKMAQRRNAGYSYANILAHMSAKYGLLASSGNARNSGKNSITKLIEKEGVMVKLTDVYVK